jgi:hypothetical protein
MFQTVTKIVKWVSIPALLIASLFACCAARYEPLVDGVICLGAIVFILRAIWLKEYFGPPGFLRLWQFSAHSRSWLRSSLDGLHLDCDLHDFVGGIPEAASARRLMPVKARRNGDSMKKHLKPTSIEPGAGAV